MPDQKDPKEPKDESFKVIDRRPFTAEGELRPEALDEERREREAAERREKNQQESEGAKRAAAKNAGMDAAGSGAGAIAGSAPNANLHPSRNFQMLIDFLARNCAALLGGMTDPRTGQPLLDLEGAREMIDMLDALREFTHGNLATEDDQLLVEVIGSLKLSFMDVSKAAAGPAPGKPRPKP